MSQLHLVISTNAEYSSLSQQELKLRCFVVLGTVWGTQTAFLCHLPPSSPIHSRAPHPLFYVNSMGAVNFWQVMDKALDMQRQCDAAESDPLAHSMDDGEAPLLLPSASPQRSPHQRLSLAASAVSSLTRNPMLLSGSGTGMMTVVKTQFVPLGDSLSDSDSDSEVIVVALSSFACTLLFNQIRLTVARIAACT